MGDKHHTDHFAADVEYLAARALQALDAQDANMLSAGLGIPSDIVLVMDGVPIGNLGLLSQNETLFVLCIGFVNPLTYKLHGI